MSILHNVITVSTTPNSPPSIFTISQIDILSSRGAVTIELSSLCSTESVNPICGTGGEKRDLGACPCAAELAASKEKEGQREENSTVQYTAKSA
jgi:hypothetical protein